MAGLALFLCCLLGIYRFKIFRDNPIHPLVLIALFVLKLATGSLLIWIYTFYYKDISNADVYKYLLDAKVIADKLQGDVTGFFKIFFGFYDKDPHLVSILTYIDHWYLDGNVNPVNDSRLLIRYNLLLMPLTGGKIFVHLLLINFWAFAGQSALFVLLTRLKPGYRVQALLAVYLVPSVLFWTSGILKESMLMGFMGFFLLYLYECFKNPGIKPLLLVLLFGTGLFFSKFYVLLAFAAALPAYLILQTRLSKNLAALLLVMLYGGAYFFTCSMWLPVLSHKQREFNHVAMGGLFVRTQNDTLHADEEYAGPLMRIDGDSVYFPENIPAKRFDHLKDAGDTFLQKGRGYAFLKMINKAGSRIVIPECDGHPASFLGNLPAYVFNALLRPNLREVHSALQFLPALENVLMVLLLFWVVISRQKQAILPMEVFFWVFSLWLLMLIGAVTPVVGAIVRYKVPALPLLWWSLLARAKKNPALRQDSPE